MQVRTIITGHRGFIGSHLIKVFDNYVGYDLKDGADILDRDELEKLFNYFKPEVVIHLAAKTGVPESWEKKKEYFDTNIIGTGNILEMCDKYKVGKLIYASSSSVYTADQHQSPYGISKTCAEYLFNAYPSLNYSIMRFFNVYGLRGRCVVSRFFEEMKHNMCLEVNGTGKQKRYFTYIDDIVNAICNIIPAKNKIVDVRGNELTSVNEIIDNLERVFLRKATIIYKDIPEEKGVYSKYEKEFNFNMIPTNLWTGIQNYNLKWTEEVK